MVILSPFGAGRQVGVKFGAVNGAEYLASGGRLCPCCGDGGALTGNGRRRRTYREKPVRRGLAPPQTFAYRVFCTHCRHHHTILPIGLGPHKRYSVDVIESAVRGRNVGEAVGRVSARLGGVSPERIQAWWRHVIVRLVPARLAAEAIVVRDPMFALPAALPGANVFAYLQSLLGIGSALGVLATLNLLFSANLPIVEPLLLHPPTSSGRPSTPCLTIRTGGVPFG